MGPAPQPPHERAWRHPSELGPTADQAEVATHGNARALLLATGVVAAMMAAVLVVGLAPAPSSPSTAVSATTLPALTIQLRTDGTSPQNSVVTRDAQTVRIAQQSVSKDRALALVGSPNAVSAMPNDPSSLAPTEDLPAAETTVFLLTRSHTYVLRWGDVDRVDAPDGSVVITADGGLIGTFADGRLELAG